MGTHYCPYTDQDLDAAKTTPEHIIPLALGGSNQFVIPVDHDFNVKVGSSIDGVLANDPLISLRRTHYDTRGHSGKEPSFLAKRSGFVDNGAPLQVAFQTGKRIQVWDPISCCSLPEELFAGREIQSQFTIDRFARLKFGAKVALAAGYFVYGNLFRQCVRHKEIRALMNFGPGPERENFEGFELRAYHEFGSIRPNDEELVRLMDFFCSLIYGSCVFTIPGPKSLGIVVGILGGHIATLNVPASTVNFPVDGDHDLGHVVALCGGRMSRLSYRQLAVHAKQVLSRHAQGRNGQ